MATTTAVSDNRLEIELFGLRQFTRKGFYGRPRR